MDTTMTNEWFRQGADAGAAPGPTVDIDELLRSVGITVTEEGKMRARERRLAAAARHTPEMRRAWRMQAGLPADPA